MTVIAYDSFPQVIDAARDSGLIHKKLTIGEGGDVTTQKPRMVEAPSVIQAMLQKASRAAASAAEAGEVDTQPGVSAGDTTTFEYDADPDGPAFTFSRPEEVKLAESILANVLPGLGRKVNRLADVNSAKMVQQVASEAVAALQANEDLFKTEIAPERATQVASQQFNFSPDDLTYIAGNYIYTDHSQWITASGGVSYNWHGTRLSADLIYGSGLRQDSGDVPNGGTVPPYTQVNFGVSHRFEAVPGGPIEISLNLINAFDKIYEIRSGSGVGVFAPQYGPRRTIYAGVRKFF